MNVYPQTSEENLRDQLLVRDWVKSGFLDDRQGLALQADLPVSLRRTHNVLRAVLALFTVVIIQAAIGLTAVVLAPGRDALWLLFGIWALICAGSAWVIVRAARLYRCGVEEALAVLAVVFLSGSVGSLPGLDYPVLVGILTGVLGMVGVYIALGYRYAIVGATILAGLAPFGLRTDAVPERLLALLVYGLVFLLVSHVRGFFSGDIQEDDFAAAQGATYASFYLTCNLMITSLSVGLLTQQNSRWFYWSTYVICWIIPALALWWGIRRRDRILLDLGWISMLATILTNKPYLRWTRQTWDPILLGALLIVGAIVLRRCLARGPNGERHGFTPLRVLDSENRALAAASAISLALPHAPSAGAPQSASFKAHGGESGGGGASGSF